MTTSTRHHAITPLCEPETYPVELVDTHVTRRRISAGFWPRTQCPRDMPTSMRISVRTPAGIYMKCKVYLRVAGDYVIASARPNDQVYGEDLNCSGAFPLACEIEAEKLALENL